MENSREQMIEHLREAVEKMKESLALMEKELAFLEGDKAAFIDEEFDISLEEPETVDNEIYESEPETVEKEIEESEPEDISTEYEDMPEQTDGDLFGLFSDDYLDQKPVKDDVDREVVEVEIPAEPENINEMEAAHRKPALMDVMEEKLAWRIDIPGAPVNNILSAVSLNDRVMFINSLFGGDPLRFQETVAFFNSLESFDVVEDYVREHFADWDLESDTVYRFMMAVRRKLR